MHLVLLTYRLASSPTQCSLFFRISESPRRILPHLSSVVYNDNVAIRILDSCFFPQPFLVFRPLRDRDPLRLEICDHLLNVFDFEVDPCAVRWGLDAVEGEGGGACDEAGVVIAGVDYQLQPEGAIEGDGFGDRGARQSDLVEVHGIVGSQV